MSHVKFFTWSLREEWTKDLYTLHLLAESTNNVSQEMCWKYIEIVSKIICTIKTKTARDPFSVTRWSKKTFSRRSRSFILTEMCQIERTSYGMVNCNSAKENGILFNFTKNNQWFWWNIKTHFSFMTTFSLKIRTC